MHESIMDGSMDDIVGLNDFDCSDNLQGLRVYRAGESTRTKKVIKCFK